MYKRLTNCLCCGEVNLIKVLDLGDQPLANSYLKYGNDNDPVYPLAINFCTVCTHIQLTHAVDPDLLFKHYLYVSGTTTTLKNYFSDFVDIVKRFTNGKKVLDIACNDGSQLDAFKEKGYTETYGIDPAENLYSLSSTKHKVICEYFNESSIKQFNTKFDVIIAQNVFAHNSYPKDFLEYCKRILDRDGFIFLQTSQADMVKNNQFDTIYHEHISFFSVKSMSVLARRCGLYLKDVIRTTVHGTSFVFVLSKYGPDHSVVLNLKEHELTLADMLSYSENCISIARQTKQVIDNLISRQYRVIGYGAAAKGNTFLNFAKINNLTYVVDDNILKTGMFLPGTKTPIHSPVTLKQENGPICIVPLAWNFFDEIKSKVHHLIGSNKNISLKYLKYFPEVELKDA